MGMANKKAGMRGKAKKNKGKVDAEAIREKKIALWATKTGQHEVKRTLENNIPVTVAKQGFVYKIYPDGSKELLFALPDKVRVTKRIFKI